MSGGRSIVQGAAIPYVLSEESIEANMNDLSTLLAAVANEDASR